MPLLHSRCLLAIAWLTFIWPLIVSAQTTPRIETLFPAGGARGSDVEVRLEAEFMPDGCRLVIDGEGVALKQTLSRHRFLFSIAATATPGDREVRLVATQGASSPFPFVVGETPEVVVPETQTSLALKTLPVTINGCLRATGATHEFPLDLSVGQQIIGAARAKLFRSPVDATLRLLDAERKVVATSFAHRTADALLVYRAPQAGRFTLQLFDFQLAGSSQHVYRLTVTDGPWLAHSFPAGVSKTKNAVSELTLFGWNLPQVNAPETNAASAALIRQPFPIPATTANKLVVALPGGANALRLPVGDHPEQIDVEPNDSAERALPLELPATVNGRMDNAEDVDWFSFEAKKGETISLDVDAAELSFPIDAVMVVSNAMGKALMEVDDNKTSRDPSLRFKVPANGRYFVSIRERARGFGDDVLYRLHVSPPNPVLSLRVNSSSQMLVAGQTANLPVVVDRVDGLTGDFEITALDLPPGVTVKPQPIPAKTPATIQLPLTVDEKQPPVGGMVRIVGRAMPAPDQANSPPSSNDANAKDQRVALIADAPTATFGSDRLWLAVSPEIPFTLKTTTVILDAPRMAAFPFPVTAQRHEGFGGEIRLVGVEADKRGTVAALEGKIETGVDAGSIPLVIQHNVTEGTTHRCRVMGVAEVPGVDGKNYPVFHVATGQMSMGCEPSWLTLTAEPSLVVWRPGETVRVEVRLMRRVPMGSITLRFSPPDNCTGVTSEPVVVESGQNRATLSLHFSSTASLPPRATATIKAESSRDGLPVYGQANFRLEIP